MRQEKQIDLLTCNVYLVQVISITSFSGDLPVNLHFVGIDIIIINCGWVLPSTLHDAILVLLQGKNLLLF